MNAQEQTVTVPEITTDINNPICYTIKSYRSKNYLHSTGVKSNQTQKMITVFGTLHGTTRMKKVSRLYITLLVKNCN